MRPFALLLLLTASLSGQGQSVYKAPPSAPPTKWETTVWTANWLVHPTSSARQYGVYHFRKTISLGQQPARFIVHVSADNQYRLFVNGRSVGTGPAPGDVQHWPYETLDLAPFLQPGSNTLAAQVWYSGESASAAQKGHQLGFVLQGDGEREEIASTSAGWKVYQNPAYSPVKNDAVRSTMPNSVGDGDRIDGQTYPWGWEQSGYDDSKWPAAKPLPFPAQPRDLSSDGNWALVPRTIPPLATYPVRLAAFRRVEGLTTCNVPTGASVAGTLAADFLAGKAPLTIPANTRATLLFDQQLLTNAYPQLTISAGKAASLTLTYAESLVDAARQRGNRNEIIGKQIVGFSDEFIADGGAQRTYRPLNYRTYRYLQLIVQTRDSLLVINDLMGEYSAYPFEQKAQLVAPDSILRLWETGLRTTRLCAAETYVSSPYTDRVQSISDARIQALVSLYVGGDDRLMRKAILDFDHSRLPDSLTQNLDPVGKQPVMPTASLLWVNMVHDFWMHRRDDAFVSARLAGIEQVLRWHENYLNPQTGLNGALPGWNFVDWAWPGNGVASTGGVPDGAQGGSSVLTLQQAYTYGRAADLFAHYGQNQKAEHYRQLARRLNRAVMERCWDSTRNLLADTPAGRTPAKTQSSQHANILAVLTDAVPPAQQRDLLKRVLANVPADSLRPTTLYFNFYLFQGLKKTGLGDEFLPLLKPWHVMLANGLTTFAQHPDRPDELPNGPDCHAGSTSPVYEFLSTVCGINPAEPGFRSVRIEPYLGTLPGVQGSIPHPAGSIIVRFERGPNNTLRGEVTLPPNVPGTLRWQGRTQPLKAGKQTVNL